MGSGTSTLALVRSTTRIQRMLRHADISSTGRYVDLAMDGVIDVLEQPAVMSVACPSPVSPLTEVPVAIGESWRGGRDSNPQLPA
jgi:hypothetical protein